MQNVQLKQFGVDSRDILIELGKMKVVGGQEDMIIDVAARISESEECSSFKIISSGMGKFLTRF